MSHKEMKVLCIEYKNNSSFNKSLTASYKTEIVKRGGASIYIEPYVHNDFHRISGICLQQCIDHVVFFIAHNETVPLWYHKQKFHQLGIKLFLYLGDSAEFFFTHDLFLAQRFDGVFTTSDFESIRFREFAIQAFPLISSYDLNDYNHYPATNFTDKVNRTISFVGDIRKADRMEQIEFLRMNGVPVRTFNNLPHNEMCKVFANSYLSLNFTKVHYATKPYEPRYQLKGRPAEVAMANGACLSEYEPTSMRTGSILTDRVLTNKYEILYEIRHLMERPDLRNSRRLEALAYAKAHLLANHAVDMMMQYMNTTYLTPAISDLRSFRFRTDKNVQLRYQQLLMNLIYLLESPLDLGRAFLTGVRHPRASCALTIKLIQYIRRFRGKLKILDLRCCTNPYDITLINRRIHQLGVHENPSFWLTIVANNDWLKNVSNTIPTTSITCSKTYCSRGIFSWLADSLVLYLLKPEMVARITGSSTQLE